MRIDVTYLLYSFGCMYRTKVNRKMYVRILYFLLIKYNFKKKYKLYLNFIFKTFCVTVRFLFRKINFKNFINKLIYICTSSFIFQHFIYLHIYFTQNPRIFNQVNESNASLLYQLCAV